jgi:hypothetical protein
VTAFANEISKDPVLFALLQILNDERCQFCPAQPASQEDGDHCAAPNFRLGAPAVQERPYRRATTIP